MAASRKVSMAMAVAIGVIAISGRARAQALGAPPEYPVEISTPASGATVIVSGPRGDVTCGAACALTLPQGDYKLVAKDAEGNLATQRLSVVMATRATVTPPDRGTRRFGVVLMSVGLAGVVVGGGIFVKIFFQKFIETIARDCAGPCVDQDVATSTWIIAGSSLATGLVVGLSGLAVYMRNKHAGVETSPLGAPPADGARLRLTPAAGPRWAGLGLTGSF